MDWLLTKRGRGAAGSYKIVPRRTCRWGVAGYCGKVNDVLRVMLEKGRALR